MWVGATRCIMRLTKKEPWLPKLNSPNNSVVFEPWSNTKSVVCFKKNYKITKIFFSTQTTTITLHFPLLISGINFVDFEGYFCILDNLYLLFFQASTNAQTITNVPSSPRRLCHFGSFGIIYGIHFLEKRPFWLWEGFFQGRRAPSQSQKNNSSLQMKLTKWDQTFLALAKSSQIF